VQSTLAAAAGAALGPRLRAAEQGFAIRLGYAAITWEGEDEKAIDEIAALGFRGIQLRSSAFDTHADKTAELRRKLEEKGLALLCFSSGDVDARPEHEIEYLEKHGRRAQFVKALGGSVLQLISKRPEGRAPTAQEFERLGRLMNTIGSRARDIGVRVVYHNHMNGFGEAPDEVARVLEATDPKAVGLLLDIAHYTQGGGDPVAAVKRHRDRLEVLHLKDVVSPIPGDSKPPRQSYRFVELGRGKVDVKAVIAAVREVSFRGPALIELDAPPDPARTPKQCAEINKRYAVETLGLSL
jgi:inosose dehydratase